MGRLARSRPHAARRHQRGPARHTSTESFRTKAVPEPKMADVDLRFLRLRPPRRCCAMVGGN